jgi:hypothetical protein
VRARFVTLGCILSADVWEKTGADTWVLIKADEERHPALSGRGSKLKSVLNWLTVLGALAVVLGKWFQLKHKERAATS